MCRYHCSVIFSTYSDCFPALLLWCLTLLFSRAVYFRQRVTLYCSAPARLPGRVTEQERIRPSHPEISSHRDERRCVNTPLFPSTSVFLTLLTFLLFIFFCFSLFLSSFLSYSFSSSSFSSFSSIIYYFVLSHLFLFFFLLPIPPLSFFFLTSSFSSSLSLFSSHHEV